MKKLLAVLIALAMLTSTAALAEAVNSKTILVSAMLVNNETGAINPVEYIAPAIRRANAPALVHIDAIQGFGKLPFRPARVGADLVSVSGHKLHAPKGVGALYVKKGVSIRNYVYGGGQENGLFSGTENVPGIAGFGAAVRALPDPKAQLAKTQALNAFLRERLSALRPDLPLQTAPSVADGISLALGSAGDRLIYIGGSTFVVTAAIEYFNNRQP